MERLGKVWLVLRVWIVSVMLDASFGRVLASLGRGPWFRSWSGLYIFCHDCYSRKAVESSVVSVGSRLLEMLWKIKLVWRVSGGRKVLGIVEVLPPVCSLFGFLNFVIQAGLILFSLLLVP